MKKKSWTFQTILAIFGSLCLLAYILVAVLATEDDEKPTLVWYDSVAIPDSSVSPWIAYDYEGEEIVITHPEGWQFYAYDGNTNTVRLRKVPTLESLADTEDKDKPL